MYNISYIDVDSQGHKGKVAVYEQKGLDEYYNKPIVFCHATGFHSRCWDEVVRQFPERRVLLIDTRCHGLSSNLQVKDKERLTWQTFTEDLVSVIEKLDLNNIIGVGHSMGGHLMIRAAGLLPLRFSQLIVLDPVVFPEEAGQAFAELPDDFVHPVASRRNEWPSAEALYKSYAKKGPFNEWNDQVLKDYCNYALIEKKNRDGGEEPVLNELACPPALEGMIYLSKNPERIYEDIPKVICPVNIYRARDRTEEDSPFDFGPSTTFEGLKDLFQQGRNVNLPEHSHFIPMEAPEKLVEWLREVL